LATVASSPREQEEIPDSAVQSSTASVASTGALEEKLRESPVFGTTKVTPVRVNGDSERALISLYEIEGYPTIKLETSSALIEYTGKRTVADLLSFLRETLG
jgi:hypothetical protein